MLVSQEKPWSGLLLKMLSNRHFLVSIGNCVSSSTWLLFWVPRGDPTLYTVHVSQGKASQWFWLYLLSLLCRFVSVKPDDFSNVDTLHNHLLATEDWMWLSFPQLNSDKSELLIIGPENAIPYYNTILYYFKATKWELLKPLSSKTNLN